MSKSTQTKEEQEDTVGIKQRVKVLWDKMIKVVYELEVVKKENRELKKKMEATETYTEEELNSK